jgi:DNA-binding transcriptional MerR regulator
MFSIGEFSKIAKISVKTLRYYDEIGLLAPARVDDFNRYRYYDAEQLAVLQKIIVLKNAGLSIRDIKAILDGGDTLTLLEKTRADLVQRQQLLATTIANLDQLINNRGEIIVEYQAIIKNVPEYTVYYKQGVVKNMCELGAFVLGSAEECEAANPDIKCIEPDYSYISYLGDEFADKDIKLEYAQAVEAAGSETDTIKFKTIKPTKVVSVQHRGSYDGLRDAYTFALNYAKENGLKITEPAREVYIDGVWNKTNQDDYLTEIQLPVL